MQADVMRVAVIGRTGRGDWGHAIDELWDRLFFGHSDAADGRLAAEVVAAADDDAAGLAAAAERHALDDATAFHDWRKMLATVKPDIVAICPRYLDCHADMAIAAAEAGARGIFMEKPFVRTPAEADAVIAACTKANTKLGLAFVNRHAASYLMARDLIEAGRVGQVLEIRARGKEDHRGGGEDLWVLGSHVLDLMVDIGGEPKWCQATVTQAGQLITKADAVEGPEGIGLVAGDAINAMFGLANGPIGSFASVKEAGLKQPNFGLTVVGSKGAIHIRPDHVPQAWLREAPLWRTDKEFPWKPIGPGGIETEPPQNVDRAAARVAWGRRAALDLVDAIATDREPETGMYAGRTVVEMTAAIYASALSGERITWPLVHRASPLA